METSPHDGIRPPKPLPRWKRRKHARVGEILAAAAQIAAEKGLEKLRMSDIAERAGVTKGTVYLYFVNKADVISRISALPAADEDKAAEISSEPQILAAE
jgi:AcrR family transcriptional regulator